MKQKLFFLTAFISFLFFKAPLNSQNITLDLNPNLKNQMNIAEPSVGVYEIQTLGADPWILTYPIEPTYDPDQVYVISFDYIATDGLDNLQIFYGAPLDPANRRKDFGGLAASSEYTTFKAFMKYEVENWNMPFDRFRIDIGRSSGQNITIRNVQLRAAAPGEVIPINLDLSRRNQMNITEDPEAIYNILTQGGDPYIFSEDQTNTFDPEQTFVISFDYISSTGLDDLQIFYGSPISPERRALLGSLPASNTKTMYSAFMNISGTVWDESYGLFRFDFGRLAGLDIQVGDLVLREPTNEEKSLLKVEETVDIEFDVNATSPDLSATEVTTGWYALNTFDNDPWIRSKPIEVFYDIEQSYIVEFEYRTETDYNELELFYGPPISGTQKLAAGAIPASSEWTTYTINPRLIVDNFQDENWTVFRFDFGRNEFEEKNIEIRNIKIRKPTAEELETEQNSDKFVSRALNEDLISYINTDFLNHIDQVKVDMSKVYVEGAVDQISENLFLAEVEPHQYGFDLTDFNFTTALSLDDGNFKIELPRYIEKTDRQYDRLYSRWAIVEKTGGNSYSLVSSLNWPNNISGITVNNLEEEKANSVKGLDGLTPSTLSNFQDLVDLDVKSMKINLLLNGVFSLNESSLTHQFNGKIYNINQSFVSNMDSRIKQCTEAGIKTSFVLLIPYLQNPELARIFDHPDASLGNFSMANVATEEGIEYYTAMVDFLAQRYSRPDEQFGRLDQWIIHNEVDAHTDWTHAGQKPVELYTQIYDRSMRMVHYTIRKYNPTAKVFSSFTKHWNSFAGSSANFKSKDILDQLVLITNKEGDYEWNIGWHSYPTNLFNPLVWNDPVSQTQFNFNTPQITPRNLEMIDAYVRQEDLLFNGKKVRTILLSENGFNSNTATNPNANETTQAAALAYFWKKTNKRLPSIENIQLHRWVDNPNEAGIFFGLWTVQEGTFDDFDEKKQGWYVWEAAGTSRENLVFEPYKDVIGISDWSEIYQSVNTEVTPYNVDIFINGCDSDLSDLLISFNGELKIPQEDGSLKFFNVASNVEQPYKIWKGDLLLESGVLNVNENLSVSFDLEVVEIVSLRGISPSEIEIEWNSNVSNLQGYVIEVSEEGESFVVLAEVDASTETYVHEGVTSGNRYAYRVAAIYDEDSQSCFSEEDDILAPFLIVDYKDGDKNKPNNNKIRPHFILRNEAQNDIDLNRATIKYWFTSENSTSMIFKVDEAGIYDVEQVAGSFIDLEPILKMADTYLEIGFTENTLLGALDNSGEIKTKIENSMPDEFNELNDYSYTEFQNYQQSRKITVYWDGELIWGDEPSGAADENNFLEDSGVKGKIYPNAATESVTLQWETDIESLGKFNLMDYQGREHEINMSKSDSTKVKFNFSNLPQGLYLLKGQLNGEFVTYRLLITE